MFPSFAHLMESSVIKVAHFKSADTIPLQRKFPLIVQNNVVDLLELLKLKFALEPFASKGLDALALHFLNIYIPKGHDHTHWRNSEYTQEQINYAASDAVVTRLLLDVALHGVPPIHDQNTTLTQIVEDKEADIEDFSINSVDDDLSDVDNDDVGDDDVDDDVDCEASDELVASVDDPTSSTGDTHKGVKIRKKRKKKQVDIDSIKQSVELPRESQDARRPNFFDVALEECRALANGNSDQVDDSDDSNFFDNSQSEIDLEFLANKSTTSSVFSYCKTLISQYSSDFSVTQSIMLPSCLSKEQRAHLHSLCAQLLLNSSSLDVGGARRLVVSRRTTFEPPLSVIGRDAIGCAVLKVDKSRKCTRGVVTDFNLKNCTWNVRYETAALGIADTTVNHPELCELFRNRFNFDNTGDAFNSSFNKDDHLLPQCAQLSAASRQRLDAFLLKISDDWYLKPDATIGQDHSHWMRNVMSMCSLTPQFFAYRMAMMDLSDVLFKIVEGEVERLHNLLVPSKYTEEEFWKLPRAWWRKWAKYHCPEPKRMMADFFEWYEFWSNFQVPMTTKDIVESHNSPKTKPFFVSDCWKIFKTEAAYIIPGHLSDLPYYSPYRIVGVTKDGREIYRCNRTTSPVEGWHHAQRADGNTKAKAAGPRQQHASLCAVSFHWNRKAAETAGVIPRLGHDEVHNRYKLIQILQGTPIHGKVREVLGWKSIDFSVAPVIPRGLDCSSSLQRSMDMPLPSPSPTRHSALKAQNYIQMQYGHGPVSTLSSGKDISLAIANREFIISPSITMSTDHIRKFAQQTGLVPTAAALEKFVQNQEERYLVQESLDAMRFSEHATRMRTPAVVDQPPLPKRVLILQKSTVCDTVAIPTPYLNNRYTNTHLAKSPQNPAHQATSTTQPDPPSKRHKQKVSWTKKKRASLTPEERSELNKQRRELKANKVQSK